jgi:phosphatidylglycerol lysyltransferase
MFVGVGASRVRDLLPVLLGSLFVNVVAPSGGAAGAAGWLLVLGPRFHARSDPPSIRRGLQVLVAALVFTLAYGILGFYLLDRHFSVNFSLNAATRQTIVMFTEFYDPGLEPLTGFGQYFAGSIYAVGAITLGYALLALVRPVLVRGPATPIEQARAQAIVEAYGRSALARFALFPDKSFYFSPGGSVVAYAARGRAAVALGDPIGPAQDTPAAIQGFKAFCARNDWQAAFYQTLPDYLEHYRDSGFNIL